MGRHSSARIVTFAAALWGGAAAAQLEPVEGIRSAELRVHAIVGGRVVTAPGQAYERATIVIRDGVIEAVGPDVTPPPEARVWSAEGLVVYPGLIDAGVLVDVEAVTDNGYWNDRIRADVATAQLPAPADSLRRQLRELGFTAAAITPGEGVLRGTASVASLDERDDDVVLYRERWAMGAGLDHGGSWQQATYPASLMGAIALFRQTLYDARWHADRMRLWRADPPGQEPPPPSAALDALGDVVAGRQPLLFDADNELDELRVARLAGEFGLDVVLLGSGLEFRRLEEVVATGLPIVLPLSYPDRPDVSALPVADDVTLRELMTWEQAPTNPRRLLEAGAVVALTTERLDKRSDFHGRLHEAIRHGLQEDAALAALTTTPARLLGLDAILGTIEPGKVANLVVVEGALLARKPKVRDVWVNGRRHEVSAEPRISLKGRATLKTDTGVEARVDVDTGRSRLTVHLPDGPKVKAQDVVVLYDRLSFVLDGRLFGLEGYVRFTGVIAGGAARGQAVLPDGGRVGFAITTVPGGPQDEDEPEAGDDDEPEEPDAEVDDDREGGARRGDRRRGGDRGGDGKEPDFQPPPEELVHPLGAFGLRQRPRPRTVAVVGATIWTCGPQGIIEDGAMLVRDGRVVSVGRADRFEVPPGAEVIDAHGRHVTPGLIDCHSHTGISGGVNEWTQAVTAEVRIGDVVSPDHISWYRQLAGGLTAANQLHGSANPIGGQNSVVKIKWAGTAGDFAIDDAIGGIKFALGENVKRSQSRYPNTRMGVEAIIRDSFEAARAYRRKWQDYRSLPPERRASTAPPRRDLELDALVEVLDGRRLVHCHSYRQDEILMLIRLAEEFDFTIGTFQHVLEGYKVAEAIAAHGAGASTFSDWWAYKVEVMDAIPFNGALMHDVGVVVSFNSDSSELARRMNAEAAKAVRYGGVDPAEAMKFVTLNPAWQLRIDGRCGSLEAGKDADFAVWSESPLSTLARCEQTWIEGARYFDLDTDRALRAEAAAERQRIIQKILRASHGAPEAPPEPTTEPKEPVPVATTGRDQGPAREQPPYSCCWRLEP